MSTASASWRPPSSTTAAANVAGCGHSATAARQPAVVAQHHATASAPAVFDVRVSARISSRVTAARTGCGSGELELIAMLRGEHEAVRETDEAPPQRTAGGVDAVCGAEQRAASGD